MAHDASGYRGSTTARVVRRATPDDLDALTRLSLALRDHHRPLQPTNPRYHVSREAWEQTARAALTDERTTVLVAEDEGRVVGFVKLSFVGMVWGTSCEVTTLVVEEAARGRGHGTALMRAAERHARATGARAMRVNVLENNRDGRTFYERLGYATTAVRYGKNLGGEPPAG